MLVILKRLVLVAIAGCYLVAGPPLLAQEPPVLTHAPAEHLQELETVVVYGGYATPQMWKISKSDHVLWLLLIGNAAPAGVQWRTEQLEVRVAESQLVLYDSTWPRVSYPESRRSKVAFELERENATQLPGDDTLKDVLAPEIYIRWRNLKTAYIGSDDAIERRCLACAMEELELKVLNAMPSPGPALQPLVDKAAKNYKVKIRTMPDVEARVTFTQAELNMSKMQALLDMGDVDCFTQRLDILESLVKDRDQQGIATLRSKFASPSGRCSNGGDFYTRWVPSGKLPDPAAAQSASEKFTLQRKLAWRKLDAEWMAAAQAALAKNKSTIAALRSRDGGWSHVNSYIEMFRDLGYEVEEPGSVSQ